MKKWQIYRQDPTRSQQLSGELKISPLTAQILINRGLDDPGDAEKFLNPRLSNLKDPFEIPHMSNATRRILQAKERGEKVTIYGDYDVDGVTGTVILLETLKYLGINCDYYIPHRYGEGYSLNQEAIQKIKGEGAHLILTVDCGIASTIEIELANSLGMEVIVTDHHNLPNKLPSAYSLVNPKLIQGEHPSKHLSGAGVAFKFAWALLRSAGITEHDFLTGLLDLAALGTIADVVPLTGENRIFSVQGLNLINQRKRLGIKYLAEAASLNGKITINNINFALAPRLNAAGRLEHASLAVKLLTSSDPVEAKESAKALNQINSRRQGIGENIQEEVFSKLQVDDTQKILIASGENWHPGVIGIVASRVVDTYYRPAVLIGINEGVGRGSARSIDGFNIFALLNSCRDLFLDFGGHEGAAGFEIDPINIPELKRRLISQIEAELTPEILVAKLSIDAELPPPRITLGLIKELQSLSPYGQGNPAPLFLTRNLTPTDIRQVGSDGSHLKIKFMDAVPAGRQGKTTLEVIGFRLGKLAKNLTFNKTYDITYNLESNEWNGFETAQLNLVDIKEAL
jgi:single-stranded-DNA-specific exonuclease